MKPNKMILPIVCCIPLMNSCATDKPMEKPAWNIQPVYKVNNVSADNPNTLYQLGRYYQGQRRYTLAAEYYRKALAADDGFVEAHNGLGVIYSMQGQFDAAVTAFKFAINLAPKSGHLFNNLGHTLYLQGTYAEAVYALEQAANLDPGNARILNNLGLAYVKAGEVAKSRQAFVAAAKPIREGAAVTPQTTVQPDVGQGGQVASSAGIGTGLAPAVASSEPPLVPTTTLTTSVQPANVHVPSNQAHEPAVQNLALPKDRGVIMSASIIPSPVPIKTSVAATQIVQIATESNGHVEPAAATENVSVAQVADKAENQPLTVAAIDQPQPSSSVPLNQTASGIAAIHALLAKLEVSNGNGTAGMARKVANFLQQNGYEKARLTNRKPFTVQTTQIHYRHGHEAEAEYLRASFPNQLPISAAIVQNNSLRDDINLRVILGKDLVQHTAYFNGINKNLVVTRNDVNY
jgi:Tfp pilus assembly protein PilF